MAKKKTTQKISIGKKIKKARTAKKLAFDQLANETGFSVEYLKEIESGKTTPPVGTLLQISRALEIDSGTLLKNDETKIKSRVKAYTKRTDNYAYTTSTVDLAFSNSEGVTVAVSATTSGWAASATHSALGAAEGCALYYGTATAPTVGTATPTSPGEVACTN